MKKSTRDESSAKDARALRERLQGVVDSVIINDGSTRKAGRHLGRAHSTVQDQYQKAVEMGLQPSAGALEIAGLKAPKSGPFSEDDNKYKDDWTADDCVAELQRVVSANPEKVISRNFFRVYSCISESTWNRYFGSFQEFKRQAGIVLSRHAHSLERSVAKHASVDNFRETNIEKASFEGKYVRPGGGRFKTVLVCSDVHDKECDPFYRRLFIDTAKRVQPETIVFNGDIFDLPEFSKFTQDPRDWDLIGRIKWVHQFMRDLREACPDAWFLFVEGNHEFRLLRHLSEATPAMRVILSDLHGMTVSKLLGLDEFEINFVARADLAAWTERDIKKELQTNWICLWESVIAHHFPEGRQMGMPGWNGHHHKHIVWANYSPTYGPFEWHQLGSGHRRDAVFCNGEKWANGFLMAHVDTLKKRTQFEYIQVGDHAMIGGKWYERTENEICVPAGLQ